MSKLTQFLEIFELLEESKRRKTAQKKKFIEQAEEKRLERSKNCVVVSESIEEVNKNITRHIFEISSDEKSESESHNVIVEVFNKSGRVDAVSCSCADHNSRFARYLNEDGLAPYNRVKAKNEIFNPHTEEKPDIMNPKDNLGMACKHVIKAITTLEPKLLETD